MSDAELQRLKPYFALGHQGDLDYTQIRLALARTPTERLDHHEGWRLFAKEAQENAALRHGCRCPVQPGSSESVVVSARGHQVSAKTAARP
jgi:hypothetical protein